MDANVTPPVINLHTYTVSSHPTVLLSFYSADWCKPCSRIKPHIFSLVENGTLVPQGKAIVARVSIPSLVKTPYFRLTNTTDSTIGASVETSNIAAFDDFLSTSGAFVAKAYNDSE